MENTYDKWLEANAAGKQTAIHRIVLSGLMHKAKHAGAPTVFESATQMQQGRRFHRIEGHGPGSDAYHEQYHMQSLPGGTLLFRKKNKYHMPSPEQSTPMDLPHVMVGTILHHSTNHKLDHPFVAEAHRGNVAHLVSSMHPEARKAVNEAVHDHS